MTIYPETVADLMSRDVLTLNRNDEIGLAEDVMNLGRVRHIPIVDDEAMLVGILSQRDLFRSALLKVLGYSTPKGDTVIGLRIKSAMTTEVLTTDPTTPLRDAAALMSKQKVGCLPVLEDGALVGILTEGDFVDAFANNGAWGPPN